MVKSYYFHPTAKVSISPVATPDGNQILIDFTMLPTHAAKLDGRDLALVQAVQFIATDGRIEAVPVSNPK